MTVYETTNFGFVAVKNEVPSVRDWSPVYHNWIAADSLIYGVLAHQHTGTAKLADPSGTLGLTSVSSGGTVAAGTYYFCITYFDDSGLETGKSDVASITLPPALSPPSIPTINDDATPTDIQVHTPNGLAGGNYWYKLAYTEGNGETTPSSPLYVKIPIDTTTYECTIHFQSITEAANGADSILVYRKTGNTGSYVKLATITNVATNSYTDDNSGTPVCDKAPVTVNTTGAYNTITIDWSDFTTTNVSKLRVYVSATDDDAATPTATWNTSYMLIIEEDLTIATPVSDYTWTGTSLYLGKPPEVSLCYPNPSKINLTNAAEIYGNLPWENLPSDFTWQEPVANAAALPTGIAGEARVVLDEDAIYVWDADAATPEWVQVSGNSGFRGIYADFASLPTEDNEVNDVAFAIATPGWYFWQGSYWSWGTPTPIDTIGYYGEWNSGYDEFEPEYGFGAVRFNSDSKAFEYWDDGIATPAWTEVV